MTAPASAMSIISPTVTGYMENATAARPSATRPLSSSVPRTPPMNEMRGDVRGSSMPSTGARKRSCSTETSSDETTSVPAGTSQARSYHFPARNMRAWRPAAGVPSAASVTVKASRAFARSASASRPFRSATRRL